MVRSVSFLAAVMGLAIAPAIWGGDKELSKTAEADAREEVTQALLAETLGNNSERTKRLTKAWLAVPDLAEANWHMARTRAQGKWLPLAEVVSRANQDPDQERYRSLRARAIGNPKALRDLARWCAKRNWHDRARLHYAQLLANPKGDVSFKSEAVEKLNLVQVNGAWLTKEEVHARQDEAKAIQDSLTKWRPKLKALQVVIDGEDFAARDKAIAELATLDDSEMIAALESFLLDGRADFQEQAVKKLGTFRHHESTEAIVRYSVLSESAIVRREAMNALRQRPMTEYCPLLLEGVVAPIRSRFEIRVHPGGKIEHVHVVAREGSTVNQLLYMYNLAIPSVTERVTRSIDDGPVQRIEVGDTEQEAARRSANQAKLAVVTIESQIAIANASSSERNRRLFECLEYTTRETLSRDLSDWWDWWQTYNEKEWPKTTQYAFSVQQTRYSVNKAALVSGHSCFLAGTLVRTEMGTVPIESIRPGDRVLAQDQDTGELTYKVVLTTTLRPPAKMVRIRAGGEGIATTLGHPFWVSGQGWKMAKQLKEGDLLHSLGGAVPIESIAVAGEEPAHNLVVDDFNTYFVGQAGLLVHDNEFRKPTRAIVPGLVKPD